MIKYALRCANAHEFEVWFNSMAAYDEQKSAKLLRCPVCDDAEVEKALMAPSVVTTKGKEQSRPEATDDAPAATPTPAPDRRAHVPVASGPPPAKVIEVLREMREFVEANTDNVGKDFAEEARKIHYQEAEPRGIRGEATASEVEDLQEEGIAVAAIPRLPEDHN